MRQREGFHHAGASSRRLGFSAFSDNSHIMRSVNPFNMNQTTTKGDDFRAMKIICNMDTFVVSMGTFVYNSVGSNSIQFALYDEAGLIIGKTGPDLLDVGHHEEHVHPMENPVRIFKETQYWLGLYIIDSITIPYQVGFANLNAVFPFGMHSVRDMAPGVLPLDISAIPGTSQKFSIWANCQS